MEEVNAKVVNGFEMVNDVEPFTIDRDYRTKDGKDFRVHIEDNLTFEDVQEIIDSAVTLIIGTGEYRPEYKLLVISRYIIEKMTDIPLPKEINDEGEEIIDYEECYNIFNKLSFDTLYCHSLEYIDDCIDKKVDFQKKLTENVGINKLSITVDKLVANLSEALDLFNDAVVGEEFNGIKENIVELFPSLIKKEIKE